MRALARFAQDVLTIAEITVREASRRFVLTIALALSALFVGLYALGFYFVHKDIVDSLQGRTLITDAGFNMIVMTGMYVVAFLGAVMAVLVGVGTLAGEITSHTIQSLAARPIRRASLVLGKWLGLAVLVTVLVTLLAGGVMGATYAVSGYLPPNAVRGVALLVLEALVILSVTVLGSTRLSTAANGVVALMLYGVAFVGGWVEQIGAILQNQAAVNVGIVSSLLVPSEALWKLAAYSMQPPIVHSLAATPFAVVSVPSPLMLAYAVMYAAVAVALAVRLFATRDL